MRRVLWGALALGLALAGAAQAAPCDRVTFDGAGFVICRVDPGRDDLRLFWRDGAGEPYGDLDAVAQAVGPLDFAMNAGMFHPDLSPVGLYVEDGTQVTPLLTGASDGNFGMLPNGVLCTGADFARVVETLRSAAEAPACRDATQSGPMLVIDGELHPRFLEGSTSRHIRNGVGTDDGGRVAVFAISERPVTFHQFARLFRDGLGLTQALYLDGSVSRLYAPGLGLRGAGRDVGPIVAVVAGGAE